MEAKVHLSSNGQSVNQDDFNAIGREAAMAAEWIWSQLLRLAPTGAGSSFAPVKGIIPSGGQPSIYSTFASRSLLAPSGSNDAKIMLQPFTAVIGSRANEATAPTGPHDEGTEGTRDALREIRLAAHYGQVGKLFQSELQIPAGHGTINNNRWDAIYAKVDIDVADSAAARFQKVGETAVNAISVSVVDRTKVSIGRAQGAYSTTPVKPAIPSDGGGSYYVLLGYYYVQYSHTLTSSITASRIHEAFSPVLLSPANGGSRCAPANRAYNDSGYAWAIEQWENSRGKPVTHLSPNMVGEEKRIIAINAQDSSLHASHSPNATTVIDDSIDWRKRYFTTVLEVAPASGGGEGFPHAGVANGNLFQSLYSPSTFLKAGQSFQENMSGNTAAAATGSSVIFLDNTSSPPVASGAILAIYVRASDGALCVYRNNVDADRRVLAIVTATGFFANTGA